MPRRKPLILGWSRTKWLPARNTHADKKPLGLLSHPRSGKKAIRPVSVRPQPQVLGTAVRATAQAASVFDLQLAQEFGDIERIEIPVRRGKRLRDGFVLLRQNAAGRVHEPP